MRAAVRGLCQTFHSSAIALSAAFRAEAGRPNYVTPTSYLELIGAFGRLLAAGRARVLAQQQKYEVGGQPERGGESGWFCVPRSSTWKLFPASLQPLPLSGRLAVCPASCWRPMPHILFLYLTFHRTPSYRTAWTSCCSRRSRWR